MPMSVYATVSNSPEFAPLHRPEHSLETVNLVAKECALSTGRVHLDACTGAVWLG